MHPFRSQIREYTHASHQRVDDLYSQLNLAKKNDYTHFLRSHFIAFSALDSVALSDTFLTDYIGRTRGFLAADLKQLGVDHERLPSVEFEHHGDAMGIEYVLAGAHFGNRVLCNRWAASDDRDSLSAGTYLQSDGGRTLWKRFASSLDTLDLTCGEKDVIFNSARSVFDLFCISYHHAGLNIGQSQVEQAN